MCCLVWKHKNIQFTITAGLANKKNSEIYVMMETENIKKRNLATIPERWDTINCKNKQNTITCKSFSYKRKKYLTEIVTLRCIM